MSDFKWPCDRRVAHGPHAVPCSQHGTRYTLCDFDCDIECPGVKAHPNTMIGRQRT